jgi:hypothetical protein
MVSVPANSSSQPNLVDPPFVVSGRDPARHVHTRRRHISLCERFEQWPVASCDNDSGRRVRGHAEARSGDAALHMASLGVEGGGSKPLGMIRLRSARTPYCVVP